MRVQLFLPAALLCVASLAWTADISTKNGTDMSDAEREFVQTAVDSNARELQLSLRAKDKAQSNEVRNFASLMVEEHGKAGRDLAAASQRMIQSGEPPLKHQDQPVSAVVKQLSNLEGAAFDRRYMEVMVSDHENAVRLYERQANGGKDAQLRELANQNLPNLRRHLKMSQAILSGLK